MSIDGRLGKSLPIALGRISTTTTGTFGFGQAQAKVIATGVNRFAQAQAFISIPTVCNTSSPTGNVLIMSGGAETVVPGCDLKNLTATISSVTIQINLWFSVDHVGLLKHTIVKLYRGPMGGTLLASQGFGDIGVDPTNGHAQNWSTSVVDSSPGSEYTLTIQEDTNPSGSNIWSDTRTFCVVGVTQTVTGTFGFGQAQAQILQPSIYKVGQAQADIKQTYQGYAQAQARIIYKQSGFGQVNAYILLKRSALGQAQALILTTYQVYGQSQSLIVVRNINALGQAQASIVYKRWAFSQAQAYITPGNPDGGGGGGGGGQPLSNYGPPQYVVVYDGFQLPGYPQHESFDSSMTIVDNDPFGWDGAMSQQAGLVNGHIQIDFLIYEASGWHQAKNNYHDAARIVMAERGDFAPLYIDYRDRHWLAKPQDIDYQKNATESRKTLPYTVHWEILPWAIGEEEREITGATGTLVTAGRTLASGAWTPTIVTVTGTNVTVSGYTDTEFTGYITISGIVADMILDTEAYTVEINGVSALNHLYRQDFGLFVGVGETKFKVTGASAISIKYTDRWF